MTAFWDENEGADVCVNYDLTVIRRKSTVIGASSRRYGGLLWTKLQLYPVFKARADFPLWAFLKRRAFYFNLPVDQHGLFTAGM